MVAGRSSGCSRGTRDQYRRPAGRSRRPGSGDQGEIFGVLQYLFGTSHGLTGTATCTGTVHGRQVTGPGRFGVISHEDGNCGATQTTGRNEFILRIPTAAGTRTVTGVYADTSVNTGSGFRIELTGDITGTIQVISFVGDCTTANPLTSITFVITGHVT